MLCGKKAQEGESKEHMGKSLGEGKGRNATINLVHQIRRNNVHRGPGKLRFLLLYADTAISSKGCLWIVWRNLQFP